MIEAKDVTAVHYLIAKHRRKFIILIEAKSKKEGAVSRTLPRTIYMSACDWCGDIQH